MDLDEIQKALDLAKQIGIHVQGDFVMKKEVQYEVNNVEDGGIGIQINHNDKGAAKSSPQQSIKKADGSGKSQKPKPKERELMTFQKKDILDGHVVLLFNQLHDAKWIEGTEDDFKLLFSGQRKDFSLKWIGTMGKSFMGKSTLEYLFKRLADAEHGISVPEGYTLSSILEGHFKNREGNWITGLGKGDAPNKKAIALVDEWVKLLQMSLDDMIQELRYQHEIRMCGSADKDVINDEIEEEFAENVNTYDKFDVDMQQHRWK